MKTKITLNFLLIFFTSVNFSQSRKVIQGAVTVKDGSATNILILNINTQEEVKSDSVGKFTILAKEDDVLVFSSENLNYLRIVLAPAEYLSQKLNVEMTPKLIVLDEVEINNKSFDAVNLGILQNAPARYTVAERRLETAGDFKPIHLLGLLGGSMPLDPVFNAINGKTKRLKKEVKLERKQKSYNDFQAFYPEEELIKNIRINADEVGEFTYYILDDEAFIAVLDSRNKSRMTFYLIEKYTEFTTKKTHNEKE